MRYFLNQSGEMKNAEARSVMFVFCKKVRADKVEHSIIERPRDVKKIRDVIRKLPTGEKRKLEEIDINTNPKNWIQLLVKGYPANVEEEKMENLINDFTDSMKTRMREEEKYAIGILFRDALILCHSLFGAETITPEWKVIPRMLDVDNVLRYIQFAKEDDSFIVRYYEKYATDSFADWLGLPQKDALYHFGGKYRISTEISGIVNTLEIPIEGIDQWIDDHPEIRNSRITLPSPIEELNVTQIRVGTKKYDNPLDFLQDFYAERYNINHYRDRFLEIIDSIDPYIYRFFDENDRVVRVEGSKTTTIVKKANPNFDILFCTRDVVIRESYLDELYVRFVNEDGINIFHAGLPFLPTPLEVESIKIWNEMDVPKLSRETIRYCAGIELQDRTLKRLLEYVIFHLLSKSNSTKHIYYFLRAFRDKILENLEMSGRIAKLEDKVLEFKSRDYFVGDDDEIGKKIGGDLRKKLKENHYKIYLLGVEDSGRIDSIPKSRIKSNRIENVKRKIRNASGATTVHLLPIAYDESNSVIILIGEA